MASSVDTKFTTFPVALLFPSKWLNSKAALCDMLSSGFIWTLKNIIGMGEWSEIRISLLLADCFIFLWLDQQ